MMNRGLSVCLLVALAACQSPAADGPLVVGNDLLGGRLSVASFEVSPRAVAGFDRDLEVDSAGDILIFGMLEGLAGDRGRTDPRGADLVLRSRTRIIIAGSVVGAPGLDGTTPLALDGGRGGHIILDAPEILIERVEGGAGGNGAPAGNGGDGGCLYMPRANAWRDASPGGFGGAAGMAGPGVRDVREGRPGQGGKGGGGAFWPPPVASR